VTSAAPSEELLRRIAERLKAIADPTRLKILHCLDDRELAVGAILAAVGSSQANVSKHLAVLRREGVVGSRREGLNVLYRVIDETAFTICRDVCDSLERRLEEERRTLDQGRAAAAAGDRRLAAR
jgi:DNA-binding transcriptional ArsR family regulator